MLTFKGFPLHQFQVHAAQAIETNQNVLVSAPTGSGKTLVAEYAIEHAFEAGRKVIYTSPIKALSNQKYRDFKADGVQAGLMTGDLTLDPDSPVVIMTTEIFRNSAFEDPERFADVDFVIFDEIHFLDDPERGTVWEESLIFAPPHLRFIGLSATISNLDQFGKWMASIRPHELRVIRHDKRPVPLKHCLAHLSSGLFNLAQRKRAIQAMRRDAPKGRQQRRRSGGRPDSRRQRRTPRQAQQVTGMVLDQLQDDKLLPALFFCFSRKECEIKANNNLQRNLLKPKQRDAIDNLFQGLLQTFELPIDEDLDLQHIHRRALRGVGYHHAGMLPIHKEVVERLFTSGLLQLLFTTETFALGINMPARTVVFDSLRKFDGVTFDYMRVRDYMQMAGRAGRQGMDKEGLVISVLDDDDLENAPLTNLFSNKVESVNSRFNLPYTTILNLYSHMGKQLLKAYDKSFACFQAQSGSKSKRDIIRKQAHAALRARINLLAEAGYLDGEGLLPRGRMARQINGYEIQVTELLFAGVLDNMEYDQLAATFCSLVHEDRRRDDGRPHGRGALKSMAPKVENAIRRFASLEKKHGFKHPIKAPCFTIAPAAVAWSQGADMEKVSRLAGQDGGDVVRTMRMAVQMLRQLRLAVGPNYPQADRLTEAVASINRDVVDAKRQFELG